MGFQEPGALPDWSSGVQPGGPSNPSGRNRVPTPVRASDINDLRVWLDLYKDNHAPRQGINAPSYDAVADVTIDAAVANDIRALTSKDDYSVRCNVRWPLDYSLPSPIPSLDSTRLARQRAAFSLYRGRVPPIRVFPVIGHEFLRSSSAVWRTQPLEGDPMNPPPPGTNPLSTTYFSNAYIREFAELARQFV